MLGFDAALMESKKRPTYQQTTRIIETAMFSVYEKKDNSYINRLELQTCKLNNCNHAKEKLNILSTILNVNLFLRGQT